MRRAALPLTMTLALAACSGGADPVHAELTTPEARRDALAVSDALEALIADSKDAEADRAHAYELVRAREEDTAAYAFARAAVAGRLAQVRGLSAATLVGEVERWALKSRALDPSFRDGAATRMLGSLYVLAPAALLSRGDSEVGLELLERLVAARPDVIENHLRLAEALIALGDAAPAAPHLCRCAAARSALRRDEAQLLDRLFKDAENPACPPGARGGQEGFRGAEQSR